MIINKSKFSIKVPKYLSVFYFEQNNILIFKINKKIRFLKLSPELKCIIFKNKILIFNSPFTKISNINRKILFYFKKVIKSFFKQFLIEIKTRICVKLKLIGVGYKIFETKYKKILLFKVGHSHSIYLKFNFKKIILKSIKLFVIGNFFQNVIKTAAFVRSFKFPESYKGKGIQYFNEKVEIKEGKKI